MRPLPPFRVEGGLPKVRGWQVSRSHPKMHQVSGQIRTPTARNANEFCLFLFFVNRN